MIEFVNIAPHGDYALDCDFFLTCDQILI